MLTGSIAGLYVLCLRYVFGTIFDSCAVCFGAFQRSSAHMRSEGYCSWVCLSVCVCLPVKPHLSSLEHLFVLQLLMSRTQQATKVTT